MIVCLVFSPNYQIITWGASQGASDAPHDAPYHGGCQTPPMLFDNLVKKTRQTYFLIIWLFDNLVSDAPHHGGVSDTPHDATVLFFDNLVKN